MDLKLIDKTYMVAASSKGLGFGIAEALAQEGANVSIASRTLADITTAAEQLNNRYSGSVRGYTLDAADAESIQNWTDATVKDFGTIDGLVVNAGGPPPGKFDQFDDDAWQKGFELTLMSAVRMIRAVLPTMRTKGSGSIVTVTSTSIKEPIDVLLLSNVFRSGVVSLVKSLSRDLAAESIRINNLVPGRMDTDLVRVLDSLNAKASGTTIEAVAEKAAQNIPLGRYGSTQDFGKAAAFLLSEAASYTTGTTLVVDGGTTKAVW